MYVCVCVYVCMYIYRAIMSASYYSKLVFNISLRTHVYSFSL